jgi:aryl-alcohol dehydrogenase-like predicted oxidoreductase/histidinol phosphatase-like enzyme/predicted kinase
MRLSTDPARDAAGAVAVLQAALDAGVTLIDTADAYALDTGDIGHNERCLAEALTTWSGDSTRITIATKGGLTRPDGRWVPDGRARHIRSACHASHRALGGRSIDLYQLHAPDPRVAITTSVRALASLLSDGVVKAVGLCNVTVRQIEAARAIVPIAAVQVELSPWKDRAIAGGVVEHCLTHDITVLAYRPLGGVTGARRLATDAVLCEIAAAHGVSPFSIVLAWMRGLSAHIVPLPGPTTVATARSCGLVQALTLDRSEQRVLNRRFPPGRLVSPAPLPPKSGQGTSLDDDVVMVMGLPGAGKTTMAVELAAKGYERLNRDEIGGSLSGLMPQLQALLERGTARIVLDNTYLSRASRRAVIEMVARHGRTVRGVWIDARVEDAQVNVVWRMVGTHGRLLSSEELKGGRGPDRLAPSALFRAQREVDVPDVSEGFAALDVVPFVRRFDASVGNRAVVIWCDGILRPASQAGKPPRDPTDPALTDRLRARLQSYQDHGWRIVGLAWEPQIDEGRLSVEEVQLRHATLAERLGVDISFHYCPHGAGPPVCWCRKPLPGLGVWVAHRFALDVQQSIFVGSSRQDESFARRIGFSYQPADAFFAEPEAGADAYQPLR